MAIHWHEQTFPEDILDNDNVLVMRAVAKRMVEEGYIFHYRAARQHGSV